MHNSHWLKIYAGKQRFKCSGTRLFKHWKRFGTLLLSTINWQVTIWDILQCLPKYLVQIFDGNYVQSFMHIQKTFDSFYSLYTNLF